MDWKLASRLGSSEKAICYRLECLSCEFYRKSVMGGLILDGQRQKEWWCVLIDERREPCKIKDKTSERINPPPKRRVQSFQPQTEQPQTTTVTVGKQVLQPELSGANVPSLTETSQPHHPKLEPVLPNLPNMETRSSWRGAQKRKRTE